MTKLLEPIPLTEFPCYGGDVWARVDDGHKMPVTIAPTDVKGLLCHKPMHMEGGMITLAQIR